MKIGCHQFKGWSEVARHLRDSMDTLDINSGQKSSLLCIAKRLPQHGVLIADEVGMGKTRIAAVLSRSVVACGGRVAILIPPGLRYGWQDELGQVGVESGFLGSFYQYLEQWDAEAPWFAQNCLLISQHFANWRLGKKSAPWRIQFLPALLAYLRKQRQGRFPRGYHQNEVDDRVSDAVESVVAHLPSKRGVAAKRIRVLDKLTWQQDLWNPGNYARAGDADDTYRDELNKAVGLGLGAFDLVIIDEAHKARKKNSLLSLTLDEVLLHTPDCRCVGMTATPVELEGGQWESILSRIGIEKPENLHTVIDNYIKAVNALKHSDGWLDEERVSQFEQAAGEFQNLLEPYVLRRDKNEDACIQKFARLSKEPPLQYRRVEPIVIEPEQLGPEWKMALCAAEALSFLGQGENGSQSRRQRARLGLGSGLSLAALMDKDDEQESIAQSASNHREKRAVYWQKMIRNQLGSGDGTNNDLTPALYYHPTILAAVEAIEKLNQQNEKVLVFGLYTQPMRALQRLLNARAMLRALENGGRWPQSVITDGEGAAVVAALDQAGRNASSSLKSVKNQLQKQYQQHESQMKALRENLYDRLRKAAPAFTGHAGPFLECLTYEHRPMLARALYELMGEAVFNASDKELAEGYCELMKAWTSQERLYDDAQGNKDGYESMETLRERLEQDFSGQPTALFARLMQGNTRMSTRHNLQLNFNRDSSPLKVLITQSRVGSEGLNLHEACRHVLLLHLEWNPGRVEQQIGRVDRLGSRWHQLLEECQEDCEDWPRIVIHPIIFAGGYDQFHWQVLKRRWDELRAQLHGDILPHKNKRGLDSKQRDLWERVQQVTPDYSPGC